MRQATSRPEPRGSVDAEFRILENSNVVAMLAVAADGRITRANACMRRFLEIGDVPSVVRLDDHLVDLSQARLWSEADGGGKTVAIALRSSSGSVRTFRGEIAAVGDGQAREAVGVFTVDDDENVRAAVQHSARMEALRSLTAGVAHDFNNLLTVLVGNLYLIGEDLRQQPKLFTKLKAARDAAKRGSDLIKQLMAFARREDVVVGNVSPAKVIEDLEPLLRRALGARITLETASHADVGSIRANTAQLESAIVNLAVNARDAIEGKGKISIEARREHVTPTEAGRKRLPHAGAYVAVSVSDTGSGIPPDVIERVFEPFFSTKGERGGTGLGLSMVRWFAEQAGGAVELQSAVGCGTVVTLRIPQQLEPAADGNDKTMPLSTLPGGSETVVVLAADGAIRATIHQTLEVLGYRVVVATGVDDTLALVAAENARLLLTDGLGSGELDVLTRARAAQPELKVIVTIEAGRPTGRAADCATLTKPFSLAELAGTVRRTLDGSMPR